MLFIVTRILNIGNVSYEYNQVGFKSVFLSLNSVNIALILLYTYSVFRIFDSKHPWRWGAATVYVAIPMLMLGTKTSIAIILVVPVLCTFLHLRTRKGKMCIRDRYFTGGYEYRWATTSATPRSGAVR